MLKCLGSSFSACVLMAAVAFCMPCYAATQSGPLGIFEGQTDIGSVTPPGTFSYDAAANTYTITSAGENLWSTTDAFHFVWKKVSGDVSLTADIDFPVETGEHNPHRKALLMFRKTLDPHGVYADAALHGAGLTALQYRRTVGATTQDIELAISAPSRLRLEKRGDTVTMYVSTHGEPLHQVGASISMHFDGPFYAGIGVCSHDPHTVEKAVFSHVALTPLAPLVGRQKLALFSTLKTISIDNNARVAFVVASVQGQMEAPNWSRDGKTLIFNRDGKIWTISAKGGIARQLDIGAATRCTGSHGLSPDGKLLAISCSMPDSPRTRVYIVPSSGGTPRLLTENPASYFHSWSPDSKTILFTRPDHGSINIYAIPASGGEEHALTTGKGTSDDPDYSPDGRYIYFNSDRGGGTMQIWRMRADGSDPEQVTSDDYNNWTAHPSPDGKSIVIVSYAKDVTGHPANKDVTLRILNVADGKLRDLVEITGGAGSDNVPCWAPDGQHFAFVSYQMLPVQGAGVTR